MGPASMDRPLAAVPGTGAVDQRPGQAWREPRRRGRSPAGAAGGADAQDGAAEEGPRPMAEAAGPGPVPGHPGGGGDAESAGGVGPGAPGTHLDLRL